MLPFMASGRIVRDYGVLFKYVELLEKRGRGYEARRALPTSEDIEYLKCTKLFKVKKLERRAEHSILRICPERDSCPHACHLL